MFGSECDWFDFPGKEDDEELQEMQRELARQIDEEVANTAKLEAVAQKKYAQRLAEEAACQGEGQETCQKRSGPDSIATVMQANEPKRARPRRISTEELGSASEEELPASQDSDYMREIEKLAEEEAKLERELEAKRKQRQEEQVRREKLKKDRGEEERAKAELAKEQARKEAEERARKEAEEQARKEAEERERKEAEERANKEAEEQARKEAEEQARKAEESHLKREALREQLAQARLRNMALKRKLEDDSEEGSTVSLPMASKSCPPKPAAPEHEAPPSTNLLRQNAFLKPAERDIQNDSTSCPSPPPARKPEATSENDTSSQAPTLKLAPEPVPAKAHPQTRNTDACPPQAHETGKTEAEEACHFLASIVPIYPTCIHVYLGWFLTIYCQLRILTTSRKLRSPFADAA